MDETYDIYFGGIFNFGDGIDEFTFTNRQKCCIIKNKSDMLAGGNMKPRIPRKNRDLRRYVGRRRLLSIGGYAALIAIFWASARAYNAAHTTYEPHRLMLGWKLAIWMGAAVVLGFFLFRIGRLLTDKSFEGEILSSDLLHTYTSSRDPGAGKPVSYDFRLHKTLTVLTEDGKKRKLRFEQKTGSYLYYYPGTHICHFAGLPYPVADPSRRHAPERKRRDPGETPRDDLSDGSVCVACGMLNPTERTHCAACGLSLIDPADLWQSNEKEI